MARIHPTAIVDGGADSDPATLTCGSGNSNVDTDKEYPAVRPHSNRDVRTKPGQLIFSSQDNANARFDLCQ